MVGSEMYSEDVDVPRAISLDYFNEVCPKEDRYILSGKDVNQGLPVTSHPRSIQDQQAFL